MSLADARFFARDCRSCAYVIFITIACYLRGGVITAGKYYVLPHFDGISSLVACFLYARYIYAFST